MRHTLFVSISVAAATCFAVGCGSSGSSSSGAGGTGGADSGAAGSGVTGGSAGTGTGGADSGSAGSGASGGSAGMGAGGAPDASPGCPGSTTNWATSLPSNPFDNNNLSVASDGNAYLTTSLDKNSAWLAKLDASGAITWQHGYSMTGTSLALYSVRATSDLGCIVGGDLVEGDPTFGGSVDAWIAKIDEGGSTTWQESLHMGFVAGLALTEDGGYAAMGSYTSAPGSASEVYLVKLDSAGALAWEQEYSVYPENVTPNDIHSTSDGGYILTGNYAPYVTDFPAWVIKVDSTGAIQWQKSYAGGGGSIRQLADGSYVMGGEQFEANGSWIVKLDATGAVTWQERVSADPAVDAYAVSAVVPSRDGGFAVAGMVGGWPDAQSSAGFFARLDSAGHEIAHRTYGDSSQSAMLYAIAPTADCGYLLGGRLAHKGGWLAKVDSNGDLQSCSLVQQGPVPIVTESTPPKDATFTAKPLSIAATPGTVVVSDSTVTASPGCP